MTGGGFGGCTVTMVEADKAKEFREAIAKAYQNKQGVTPRIYRCDPSDGAGKLP